MAFLISWVVAPVQRLHHPPTRTTRNQLHPHALPLPHSQPLARNEPQTLPGRARQESKSGIFCTHCRHEGVIRQNTCHKCEKYMARLWERENGRGKSAQSEIRGHRRRQRLRQRQRQRQPAPKLPKSFDKFVGQPRRSLSREGRRPGSAN